MALRRKGVCLGMVLLLSVSGGAGSSAFADSNTCQSELEHQATQEPGNMALLQKQTLHRAGMGAAIDDDPPDGADLLDEADAEAVAGDAQSLTMTSQGNAAGSVLGSTVAITQEGFSKIARLKSTPDMEAFLRRSIQDMGLRIVNEEAFLAVVPWFSGEAGSGSFGHFKGKILNMLGQHGSWVAEEEVQEPMITGKTAPLTESGFSAVSQLRSPLDMSEFAERVALILGCRVADHSSVELTASDHFSETKVQSLRALSRQILHDSKTTPGYWAHGCIGPAVSSPLGSLASTRSPTRAA